MTGLLYLISVVYGYTTSWNHVIQPILVVIWISSPFTSKRTLNNAFFHELVVHLLIMSMLLDETILHLR